MCFKRLISLHQPCSGGVSFPRFVFRMTFRSSVFPEPPPVPASWPPLHTSASFPWLPARRTPARRTRIHLQHSAPALSPVFNQEVTASNRAHYKVVHTRAARKVSTHVARETEHVWLDLSQTVRILLVSFSFGFKGHSQTLFSTCPVC